MVSAESWLRWIPLLPLLGAVLHVAVGYRVGRRATGVLACSVVGVSFLLALRAFSALVSAPEGAVLADDVYRWIAVAGFNIDVRLVLDSLSVVMCLVITGVGFLIHVYSTGYMAHDDDYARFFAYLNLFTSAMLVLVMADNLVLMFVGWEGVGLCSYLLIGLWYTDTAKASAGKKAFVVNRVGDAAFVLGTFLLFWALAPGASDLGGSSLRFADINAAAPGLSPGLVTAAALLLFVGATGKSAQIPLFVWLPDAMAGPTPVSALIHAATMVTAGVYMVARLNGLFEAAPAAMTVIAWVGAITALMAATVGVVQNDIKKVLAYSTVSQLGYMFMALGVGAFGAAVFHVMTHAFFKGLLFLGAGSVIHALHEEQDIRKMGGLRAKTPVTWATFAVATLAIAGVPGLAGFFSKDAILAATFAGGHYGLWLIGLAGAALTAFYMTRLLRLVFFDSFRGDRERGEQAHESPWSMTVPLIVLAVLSVVGGYLGVPHALGGHDALGSFLAPSVSSAAHAGHALHLSVAVEWLLMLVSTTVVLGSMGFAWKLYAAGPDADVVVRGALGRAWQWMASAWRVDEAYERLVVRPVGRGAEFLWKGVDVGLIDRFADGVAMTAGVLAEIWRRWNSGSVQHYALSLLAGALALVAAVLLGGGG